MKSVQIRSYFWSVFSYIQSEVLTLKGVVDNSRFIFYSPEHNIASEMQPIRYLAQDYWKVLFVWMFTGTRKIGVLEKLTEKRSQLSSIFVK